MCNEENLHYRFEECFVVWCRAVALYCKQTQIKSIALQVEMTGYSEDLDDGKRAICFLINFELTM